MIRPLLLSLALAALAAIPVPAQTVQTAPAPAAAPALLTLLTLDDVGTGRLMLRADRPGAYVAAPLLSTRIEVSVTGIVARATVTQRFRNPSDGWVEGIYAFPLPQDAAVDGLRMRIGDRFVEGRIEERKAARRVYEAAKEAGQKAALVEQERPNLFTNSVANIGPGEVVVAQITFQQALAPKDGRWSLRLPLVVAPRYSPAPVVQAVEFGPDGWALADPVPDRDRIEPPVADPRTEPEGAIRNPVEIEVDLAPGFEIAGLEAPYHEVTVERGADDRATVQLAGPAPADRDFLLSWRAAEGEPQAALFAEEAGGRDHLLLMLTPPALGDGEIGPREVILVQDVSGSMSGASIEQARAGLAMALRRLRPVDRFNLVTFSDTWDALFPAPVTATPEAVAYALGAAEALEAGGGTEMLPALDHALSGEAAPGRLRQVVFLTDGAVGNEAQMLALIAETLGETRLFTVGIGSAPNSYFMTRAAELGRGAHVHVGDLSEVAARMTELFAKIERPAITDLALALPEGVEAEMHPDPLPDLYAGEPVALSLRGEDLSGEAVLSGIRAGQPWEVRLQPGAAPERPGVAKLWAHRRIASLEAVRLAPGVQAAGEAARESVDARILDTALAYGLVSRLTSLVAVDVTPSRPADAPLASAEVPLNLPAGWDPEAFLFEAVPPPRGERAGLAADLVQRIAARSAASETTAPDPAAAAPLPVGGLGWQRTALLGLLMLAAGLAAVALARRRA